MLKIYLDWNIISYLKNEEYRDLCDYIAQVNEYFIFPYSRAHIQDLYQSKSPTNDVKFEQDLDTLTAICHTNYFPYYNKISVDVRVNYSLTTTLLWY